MPYIFVDQAIRLTDEQIAAVISEYITAHPEAIAEVSVATTEEASNYIES